MQCGGYLVVGPAAAAAAGLAVAGLVAAAAGVAAAGRVPDVVGNYSVDLESSHT